MSEGLRRTLRSYWFRCGVVSLGAGVVAAILLSALGHIRLSDILPRALLHSAVLGGLVGSILPLVGHRLLAGGTARGWMAIVLIVCVLAVAGTALACGLLELGAHEAGRTFWDCVRSALQVNLILSLSLGLGMSVYEAQRSRVDALMLALRTRELEHERSRKAALEARLSSLESRLHPHFLFNTLNAIAELIHENPDRAERTVERLATLLRASLDATERGLVPLSRELELVNDYLEIEKARLGDRLAYAVDVAPALAACQVPPLAVQTLVENSIKHAIAPRPGGGHLRIDATAADGRLVVGVWDDGPGFGGEIIQPGHGLENLQSRLAARFGDDGALTVAREGGGTRVTIVIPRTGRGT
jgi:two-component system, LytTR family, sensor histidine kinase AlgZ